MAGISSLGVGSGVLNSDLVDQLVAAERKPAEQRLDTKTARTEALISAYGTLRSAVTELRLPMRQLGSADAMRSFAATSSGSNLSVSVDSSQASRGTYSVEVINQAQSQALASTTFADRDSTAVGQGTLTFSVGDKTTNIDIDGSNNTLQGVANAINDAGAGVSAGIVDTGSGYRLVLSADETGTANAISISVADSDGNNTDAAGLSQFAFGNGTDNLEETVAAQNADLTVNGIAITRSTNTITDVVDGLTFEVTGVGTSTVKVEQDTAKVAERVQAFVDKFNALQSTISDLTRYDPESGGSLLTGDSTVRNIQNQLRQVLTNIVPGLENANVRSLADVGVSTNFDTGLLEFDSEKFKQQLTDNPDDVTALFAEQGRATDSQVEFVRSGDNTLAGKYDINVTQMATRGALVSSTVTPASVVIDGNNDNLSFRVDGETRADIQLTAGTYTREELAAEIQAQLNDNAALTTAGRKVTVGVDGTGALTFTSGKFGSESRVSLVAIDANTTSDLGLAVETGTLGLNIAGTIDGRTAQGDGQVLFLDSNSGGASGLQVKITGGDVGNRGSITFIEGISDRAVESISQMLAINGGLDSRTNALNRDLEEFQEKRADLELRIESYRERLVSQFSAADSLIARLNSTRDYITQQFAALTPQNDRNK